MSRGGQKNLRNQIDRNQIKIEPKNKLIESIGLILVFVLYNSQFKFKFTKYKNHGFG